MVGGRVRRSVKCGVTGFACNRLYPHWDATQDKSGTLSVPSHKEWTKYLDHIQSNRTSWWINWKPVEMNKFIYFWAGYVFIASSMEIKRAGSSLGEFNWSSDCSHKQFSGVSLELIGVISLLLLWSYKIIYDLFMNPGKNWSNFLKEKIWLTRFLLVLAWFPNVWWI